MQANYIDHVLIKSDGFPSYHLAHIVDDYLLGTTHIIRADERLAIVPFHIQLFQGFKDIFTRPQRSYNHNSPIQKLDNGNRRKLSKRKDPEADVQTLIDAGVLDRDPQQQLTLLESLATEKQAEMLRWAPHLQQSSPSGEATVILYEMYGVTK